jgi:thiol-disulfide isomerase/thioredoxin
MSIPVLKTKNQQLRAITSNEYVVIFFSNRNCPYCMQITPLVEKLAKNNKHIKVFKVETDSSRVSNIVGVPAFSFYKNGEYDGKIVGAQESDLIEKFSSF